MFLSCTLVVNHVPEMVLAFLLIGMLFDEIFLVWQLQDNGKKSQKWKDNVIVECAGKDLYLGKMRLYQIRLFIPTLEIFGELGNIEDFNVVFYRTDLSSSRATPAIIIRIRVVDLVSGLLFGVQVKEVFCYCELLVYLLLRESKVLDVEKADMMDRMSNYQR